MKGISIISEQNNYFEKVNAFEFVANNLLRTMQETWAENLATFVLRIHKSWKNVNKKIPLQLRDFFIKFFRPNQCLLYLQEAIFKKVSNQVVLDMVSETT